MLYESVGLCIAVLLFLYIQNIQSSRNNKKKYLKELLPGRYIWGILITAFVLEIIKSYILGFDYLVRNSLAVSESRPYLSMLNMLSQLLMAAVFFIGIYSKKSDSVFIFTLVTIVLSAILATMAGSRIALISPVVFIIIRNIDLESLNWKTLLKILSIGLIAVSLLTPIAANIGEGRVRGYDNGISNVSTPRIKDFVDVIFTKYDSVSAGAILIDRQGYGSGGLLPYVGAALVFIPRSLWPNRPVAGSSDGTPLGHPTRLVPSLVLDSYSDTLNVGVSPLHITFWQLGAIGGAFCFVLFGAMYLFFIENLLSSGVILDRMMGIYLLTIPTFHLLIPSPDQVVRQSITAVLLLVILRPVFDKLTKSKKK